MSDYPVNIPGYPMRRDMFVQVLEKDGRLVGRIACDHCDAELPYEPHPRHELMAPCELVDDFLEKTLRRTQVIIDSWEKERIGEHGECPPHLALEHYCDKRGLSADDPEAVKSFDDDTAFLREMDVLFDDAENFVTEIGRRGNVFGYCVFAEPGKGKEPSLVLAYMGADCVASLALDGSESRKTALELAKVCRLSTPDRGDVRFHEIVRKMDPVGDENRLAALERSWCMQPVEHELSADRPFSKPAPKTPRP